MRYFLYFSYDGTDYHGMQKQPNGKSIQSTIENALSTLLSETIAVTAAGRTDAGVHALEMVAHFDTFQSIENLVYRLNRFLPQSIAIQKILAVKPDAHARFDATARKYIYVVETEKNPFNERFSYGFYKTLNLEKMNKAANFLLQTEDFSSFEKLHSDNKTSICKVTEAFWQKDKEKLIFTISADRFLRNMVRSIVGTLLEVGLEKISIEDFKEIIDKKDRTFAAASAPACGLFLASVSYPDHLFYE